ncbi:MAG: SUMF1/EgtB/PvdO family nonheme iron enzyme [Spirochaetaceae bacterium]|jgi:formylglycine-generating enzyme required for sulfatase activity|nr:SUMF1/EgtB/PvdO family nonheme iron enzyme [Spirochaetaceae bacterium]
MKGPFIFRIAPVVLFFSGVFLFAQENRRYALVIGNSGYLHIETLGNPGNDAVDIAAKLRSLGYQTELRLDTTGEELDRAVAGYLRRLSSNSDNEGFFWYAGHGVQVNGENYLLPVDINADDDSGVIYGSYPLNRLLLALEETARNKVNVVVVDACRDNPFRSRRGGTRGLSRGLSTVEHPPQDLFIMFSTAPGTAAADGEQGSRNSPFAEAFLKYLDSPEILPVVASLITRETLRLTGGKQRPFQNGSVVSEIYYSLNPRTAGNAPDIPVTQPGPAAEGPVLPPGLVRIAGGTFTMGSPASERERVRDEKSREVSVGSFIMGKYEVTQGEYRELMGVNPSYFKGDTLPVEQVSWFDAVAYCNALSLREGLTPAYTIEGDAVRWDKSAGGYRLPTEAEWEYACRAGTTGPYHTGNIITTEQANFNGNIPHADNPRGQNRERTTPVGNFPPNPWGLHDMHGNVYEWCWDWYGEYPDGNGPAVESGSSRVVRGGSWRGSAFWVRSAFRDSYRPSSRSEALGFRVVRPEAYDGH